MSNATWVCFDCRQVVRRPTYPRPVVVCSLCQRACYCLGRKIPVPPKEKVAAWAKLREQLQSVGIAWAVRREKAAVAHRHSVEKKIQELEARPRSAGRTEQIRNLREELVGG
jgi:hypothetical protein